MKILRHRLHRDDGTPVPYLRSPNQSSGLTPEYVVMHYTAGSSAVSSVAWLRNPAARASAHVVVGPGRRCQERKGRGILLFTA